jgi:hypothetical protein
MKMFINEIKLSGEDDFSQRFNYVSDLFKRWQESGADADYKNWFAAKLCLEQGHPMPGLINPTPPESGEQTNDNI